MEWRFHRYDRQRKMFCYAGGDGDRAGVKRREIAIADIGGTHARFAIATIENGSVVSLSEPVVLRTEEIDRFESAWAEFGRQAGSLPRAAAIAIAGPVLGDRAPMTNGRWVLDLAALRRGLQLEALTVLNDFGAIAHAVAHVPAGQLIHIAGPDVPLPDYGTISVIGPGTGLGVAHLHRSGAGYQVQATEGGHVGFAPQDEIDERILDQLRGRHARVVNEHVLAGAGIMHVYAALGGTELTDDRAIWQQGIGREEEFAAQAVDRFCASLGAVAGDYALAHGASAVVLAGGIGQKLRDLLPNSEFGERFRAKPHYEAMMAAIPVKLIAHPRPGLHGAAVAFAREHP
jgi:glucokinase